MLLDNSFTENDSNLPTLSVTLKNIPFLSLSVDWRWLASFTWSDQDKSIYIQAYDSTNTIMLLEMEFLCMILEIIVL